VESFVPSNSNSLINEIKDDIKTKIKREFYEVHLRDRVLINRSDLILEEYIGRGNYGCVYRGILKLEDENEEVAVKRLQICEFL
jgi:ribosomal protein RSM22 (predicted rRNA methylase)